tara:strand:- start:785 stop:1060 length:276 start_codon:yes stop_codon:yes gene_type:complete
MKPGSVEAWEAAVAALVAAELTGKYHKALEVTEIASGIGAWLEAPGSFIEWAEDQLEKARAETTTKENALQPSETAADVPEQARTEHGTRG